jgi:hypothetical protein
MTTKKDAQATAKEEAVEQAFLTRQAGKETPEGKNVYEYQMSSTETALMNQDDFWKIKLTA